MQRVSYSLSKRIPELGPQRQRMLLNGQVLHRQEDMESHDFSPPETT